MGRAAQPLSRSPRRRYKLSIRFPSSYLASDDVFAPYTLAAVREILVAAGFRGRGCLEIPAVEGDRPLAGARGAR